MSREDEDIIRLQVSENMGHSRTNVTNAYYGKLSKKIQNSLGQRLGAIGLSEGKQAAIYMNPPPTRSENKPYPRLQQKTIDATDFMVVIETFEEGMTMAQMQFNFKDSENAVKEALMALPGATQAQAGLDAEDLKRIGHVLLTKYGVFLMD